MDVVENWFGTDEVSQDLIDVDMHWVDGVVLEARPFETSQTCT
jgi:hypothetical protein